MMPLQLPSNVDLCFCLAMQSMHGCFKNSDLRTPKSGKLRPKNSPPPNKSGKLSPRKLRPPDLENSDPPPPAPPPPQKCQTYTLKPPLLHLIYCFVDNANK